jgi:16S rRNA (uracil1498-N3)-methyltransferase
MQSRFLVDEPITPGAQLELRGEEMHHAARVVRVKRGERIEVFDGRGTGAEAVVVDVAKDRVVVEVASSVPSRETPLQIVLAAALIAPDKYELVLQKGCELGVTRFIPTVCDRIETRLERVRGKMDRWNRILLEATKQCGRTILPVLEEQRTFADVVASGRGLIVFDADVESDPWPQPDRDVITLLIGPEGGLTAEEITRARDAGAAACTLGPRRLRAETAAIAAVTLAGAFLGDLGPHPTRL